MSTASEQNVSIPPPIGAHNRQNIGRIVQVLAIVTFTLATVFGFILYRLTGQQQIIIGALAEAGLCLAVLALYRAGKIQSAIILTFFIHSVSVMYFGLMLGTDAQVQTMCVFLAGIVYLLFSRRAARWIAACIVVAVLVTIEANYELHFVKTVQLHPLYAELLRRMVLGTVLFLTCLMLYFFVRQIMIYQSKVNDYIRLEKSRNAIARYVRENSHQLRIELNIISGVLQHALTGTAGKSPREDVPVRLLHLRAMFNSARAATDHINNSLEWVRIEQGLEPPIKKETINFRNWLTDIVDRYRLMATDRPAFLTLEGEDLPMFITGDKNRLSVVLGNLLTNAIKFTIKRTTVTLRVSVKNGMLVFTVTDQGQGLIPAQLSNIFEPFVTEQNNFLQGTGLGLPVARHLARAMGGNVEVASIYGEGTTFMFFIPLEVTDNEEVKTERVHNPNLWAGLRILVVDDDAMSRRVAYANLCTMKFNVYTAESAAEAMKKLGQVQMDLVVLDYNLAEDSNSLQVIRWIKTNPAYQRLPVIVVSGDAFRGGSSDSRQQAMDAGADAYLLKPIIYDDLYAEIDRLVLPDKSFNL